MKKIFCIALLLCSHIANAGLWAVVNTSTSSLVYGPSPWNPQAVYQSMLPLGIAVMPPASEPSAAMAVTSTYSIVPVTVMQQNLSAGQVAGSPIWSISNTSATETIPAVYPPLAQAQSNQIAAITNAYQVAIHSNVSYMNTTFSADEQSQQNLTKMLSVYTPSGSTPAGFYWIDSNGAQVPMTLAQLQGLAQAMGSAGWAAFQNLQSKILAIKAATTVSAVVSVAW